MEPTKKFNSASVGPSELYKPTWGSAATSGNGRNCKLGFEIKTSIAFRFSMKPNVYDFFPGIVNVQRVDIHAIAWAFETLGHINWKLTDRERAAVAVKTMFDALVFQLELAQKTLEQEPDGILEMPIHIGRARREGLEEILGVFTYGRTRLHRGERGNAAERDPVLVRSLDELESAPAEAEACGCETATSRCGEWFRPPRRSGDGTSSPRSLQIRCK